MKITTYLSMLVVVVCDDVITGNGNSSTYKPLSLKKTLLANNPAQDYLPFYSEYSSYVNNVFTDSYGSPRKNKHNTSDNVVTQTGFPQEIETGKNSPNVPNPLDNISEIPKSVHLELSNGDCISQSKKQQVAGIEGSVVMSLTPPLEPNERVIFICDVDLRVPKGLVIYVKILKVQYSSSTSTARLRAENNEVFFNSLVSDLPREFVTYSSFVNVQAERFYSQDVLELYITFTAVAENILSHLYANFTSPTTGLLEISAFDGQKSYIPYINTLMHIAAPENHAVVVNLQITEVNKNCKLYLSLADLVTFRTENASSEYSLCAVHKDAYTKPLIYRGNFSVQYKSYSAYNTTYFRILFSFHRVSALPVELSENKWNCSGVHWPSMQQHFPCNFVSECVGGEDEAGCWPGSDTCSPGTFQTDGRCFSVVRLEEEGMSWTTASTLCQRRGGLLPSLSTRTLWDSVTKLFRTTTEGWSFLFIGLKSAPPLLSSLNENSWMWSDGTVAHFIKLFTVAQISDPCAGLSLMFKVAMLDPMPLQLHSCDELLTVSHLLCQVPNSTRLYHQFWPPEIGCTESDSKLMKPAYIRCPSHHFTHVFLACDATSDCWGHKDDVTVTCMAPLTSLPPLFRCATVQQSVPYTLVCDHRPHCSDGSDEDFCIFPPCHVASPFRCSGKRCVQQWERCNGQLDCDDRADEDRCRAPISFVRSTLDLKLPLKIDLDSKARFKFSPFGDFDYNSSLLFSCPDSHFLCASLRQVCLPVYFRCNGLSDCPGHEDEAACDSYTCPGFYRCRGSQVCVHESHLCDGVYQCPQRDDEMLCNETCPQHCVCHGWAFICSDVFSASYYPNLRYCDASRTLMTLAHLDNSMFLVHLSLVQCNLTELHEVSLPNLRTLDLSNNEITHFASRHFIGLTNLQFLKIRFNPLKVFSFHDTLRTSPLKILDMSDVRIPEIDFGIFAFFSSLTNLNLSGNHIDRLKGQGFHPINSIRILDLRSCPMTAFTPGIFRYLTSLETIFADNYKLCCPATLPKGFNVLNCHAPSNEVSSCDDLLRSNLYRIALAVFAVMALLGNVAALMYRLIIYKTMGKAGYDVFVTNLCMADFLMGMYLLSIGIADFRYKGVYLWEDVNWRHSSLCKLSGFISLLSSEVSVFMIFFITCDRFLVLHFPFSQLHFGKRSAQFACTVSWLTGLILAVVPLLPVTSHWEFYSQNSICIPLPTSRVQFPGRTYSYSIIIILNFIFFLFIFVGQICIYLSVRANSFSFGSACKSTKEFNIARRLITVAMADFLCWFPVGLTGILASLDVPISGEVNVGIATFVLPTNAALNPFLYTINTYLDRRRRRREVARQRRILAQLRLATPLSDAAGVKATVASSSDPDTSKTGSDLH